MITIELPWPDKRLSPNARVHWRVKYKANVLARLEGKYAVIEARKGNPLNVFGKFDMGKDLLAKYKFYPPDKRRRDIDNLLSQEKNYQDGVCEKLGVDDSRIKRTVLEWGDVVKGGKVVLRLEEMVGET